MVRKAREERTSIAAGDELYQANLRLNRAEFALRRTYFASMPRYLSVVIGNRCNINCPYCYQAKTGANFMDPLAKRQQALQFTSTRTPGCGGWLPAVG